MTLPCTVAFLDATYGSRLAEHRGTPWVVGVRGAPAEHVRYLVHHDDAEAKTAAISLRTGSVRSLIALSSATPEFARLVELLRREDFHAADRLAYLLANGDAEWVAHAMLERFPEHLRKVALPSIVSGAYRRALEVADAEGESGLAARYDSELRRPITDVGETEPPKLVRHLLNDYRWPAGREELRRIAHDFLTWCRRTRGEGVAR